MAEKANTSVRHKISSPVPVNVTCVLVPSTFRHTQRILAATTQAQPMIVNIDTTIRRYQPKNRQYPPVNLRGNGRPSAVSLPTTQRISNSDR